LISSLLTPQRLQLYRLPIIMRVPSPLIFILTFIKKVRQHSCKHDP
jgi:hypothetical protein